MQPVGRAVLPYYSDLDTTGAAWAQRKPGDFFLTGEKAGIFRTGRFWVGAALLLLAVQAVWTHVGDIRCYSQDVGQLQWRALRMTDGHELSWEGNPVKGSLHLGPLANVLAAVPLLFSRDIFFAFHFLTFLMALSWVLFFLACRRALGPGPGAWIAGLAYAFLYFQLQTPLRVVNSTYVPIFLPVYFYILVAFAQKPRRALVPALWLSVGVLMNLNLSCALLFFPTVAATRPWNSGRDAAVFAAGAALVAGLHVHLILQVFRMTGDGTLVTLLSGGRDGGGFLIDLVRNLAWVAVLIPLNLGPAPLAFGLPGLSGDRARDQRTGEELLRTAAIWALVAVAVVPILFTFKDRMRPRYVNYLTVFLCWLIGLWFNNLREKGVTGKPWVARTALFFGLLLIWQGIFFWVAPHANRNRYWNMMRLNDQVAVANRVADLILDQGLKEVAVKEIVLQPDGTAWKEISRSTFTHAGLIPYLRPDLFSRVRIDGARNILVKVTPAKAGPAPGKTPDASLEGRCIHADLFLESGAEPLVPGKP